MGCCSGSAVKQTIDIGRGYIRLATDKISITEEYEFADGRIRKCQKCDESTWMTKFEYAKWLKDNGIEILENFTQLETLPKLPKYYIDDRRRNIFCRICKCYIPASARVPDKKCPHPEGNKWDLNRLENDRK